VASENTLQGDSQPRRITSENTTAALQAYRAALAAAPLSAETRHTYLSKVRGYLAWLAVADTDGDPLGERRARDWAVRGYRTHLLTVAKRAPATINNTLAALDDFYTRRGLGPAAADRLDLPTQAPRALETKAALRWLRAIQDHPAPRDRVLALLPFYAGLRIAEAVGLDLDDVRLSARKGTLRVHGKGSTLRELPIHSQLRTDLQLWLDERPTGRRPDRPRTAAQPPRYPADHPRRQHHLPHHRHHCRTRRHHHRSHWSAHLRYHPRPRRHRPGHRRRDARPCPPRHRLHLHPAHRQRPRQGPQPAAHRPLTSRDTPRWQASGVSENYPTKARSAASPRTGGAVIPEPPPLPTPAVAITTAIVPELELYSAFFAGYRDRA
jgi:hypothetical protein